MTAQGCTLIALGLGLTLASGGADAQEWPPPVYSAKEIRATVVDTETGQPLDGVIMVAQWILFVAAPGHGGHGPRLHVVEAVTDGMGRFHIPGWGPKPNPRYPFTSLDNQDPQLSFFKLGYRPLTVQNRWDRNESVRFSEWDGKTIKLEKFRGTDKEWGRAISFLQTALAWGWQRMMDWRQMPRMVLALELERQRLEQLQPGIAGSGFSPSPLSSFGTTVEEVRRFLGAQK